MSQTAPASASVQLHVNHHRLRVGMFVVVAATIAILALFRPPTTWGVLGAVFVAAYLGVFFVRTAVSVHALSTGENHRPRRVPGGKHKAER